MRLQNNTGDYRDARNQEDNSKQPLLVALFPPPSRFKVPRCEASADKGVSDV